MNITDVSIKHPVTVTVGVLLAVLFGILGLLSFPIQLTPNVDVPVITVETIWPDASPQEIEQDIVVPQEEQLKGVTGLKKMTSSSVRGQASIRLEFPVGFDKDAARLDVSDRLRRVEDYPDQVNEPVVQSSGSQESEAIAWLLITATEPGLDVTTFKQYVEDNVVTRLERIEGVSDVPVYGGREPEVHVLVDMAKLAGHALTVGDLRNALVQANLNITAGDIDEEKLSVQVRGEGRFDQPEEVANVVIAYREGGPVYVRDVAEVLETHEDTVFVVRKKGEPMLAMPVRRETGSNVIEVMKELRARIVEINENQLADKGLLLEQVYDETDYIYSAIGLVRSNLLIGGTLAILVMLVFLRSGSSTLIVAIAIPVSVIATFLALSLMGRNLNVVSLAGMAFAVGMVVDNAIVVLENIYRHRQMGKDRFTAAGDGAREVWTAVLASTLTTVAVFVPVIFVEDEAGQLFRDISLAIVAGVSISLLVAITVIPTLGARIIGAAAVPGEKPSARIAKRKHHMTVLQLLTVPFSVFGAFVGNSVTGLNAAILRSTPIKIVVVLLLAAASIIGSKLLMPPASYLPTGNRNLVFAAVLPPPGYSVDEYRRLGDTIEATMRPYWESEPLPSHAGEPDAPPAMENFFFVAFGTTVFMGGTCTDETRAGELIPIFQQAFAKVPGVFGFAFQPSIFGRSVGSGRGNTIELEFSGYEIEHVESSALAMFMALMQDNPVTGGGPPQPSPTNFNLGAPELQFQPDRVKIAMLGLHWTDVAMALQAMVDGVYAGDYLDRGKQIDLVIRSDQARQTLTQQLQHTPLYTANGSIVPLGSAVRSVNIRTQQQINHIEEQRAITLEVEPLKDVPLQAAMEQLDEMVARMQQSGAISPDVSVVQAGSADKLTETRRALTGGFLLALIIAYLLMSSLFESFVHPLVIMITVPLATVGGFLGLRILHEINGQEMDVLTMLGFVILIGIVVNNAILIVHQSLNFMQEGHEPTTAIIESVRSRVRPIFMTTTTTVLGMLPLVIMPGAGSELYRGLGSVIVGGLVCGTIFTLFLVPSLFSLSISVGRGMRSAVAAIKPGSSS